MVCRKVLIYNLGYQIDYPFPIDSLGTFIQDQLTINTRVYFWTRFCSVGLCLSFASAICDDRSLWSLEIGTFMSYEFDSKIIFTLLKTLHFHMHFRISSNISAKQKESTWVSLMIAVIFSSVWENTVLMTLSFPFFGHVLSLSVFNLLCSSLISLKHIWSLNT